MLKGNFTKIFIKMKHILLLLFCLSLGCCTQKLRKQAPVVVKHVLRVGETEEHEREYATLFDFYYVYNYTVEDYPTLLKMFETTELDSNYSSHTAAFLNYNSDLPDTVALWKSADEQNKMVMGNTYDYLIVGFNLSTPGNLKPYYSIFRFEGDRLRESYFYREDTGKFTEVEESVVYTPIREPHERQKMNK